MVRVFEAISGKISRVPVYGLLMLLAGILLVLNAYCDEDALLARQSALQKKIWRTEVNDMLYRHLIDTGAAGLVVTDYQGVKYLPGFESRTIIRDLETRDEFTKGASLPGVSYLLLRVAPGSEIEGLLAAGTRAGTFQLIAAAKGFSLIKVR
jgi:hypothetical protein